MYFSLQVSVHHQKKPRQRPGGTNRSHEELLTHLFLDSHRHLSYITQDHLPRAGTADSGLGPPSSIRNQENAYRHASLMKIFLPLRLPLPGNL